MLYFSNVWCKTLHCSVLNVMISINLYREKNYDFVLGKVYEKKTLSFHVVKKCIPEYKVEKINALWHISSLKVVCRCKSFKFLIRPTHLTHILKFGNWIFSFAFFTNGTIFFCFLRCGRVRGYYRSGILCVFWCGPKNRNEFSSSLRVCISHVFDSLLREYYNYSVSNTNSWK